jgi:hypothetical protein
MKSVLNIPPERFINAEQLFAKAAALHPGLSSFDERDLESFRFKRNDIVHYGFSPRDDEEAATLLLNIGFPFLSACYREFYSFDLLDGLVVEYGQQLGIALGVYQQAKGIPDLRFTYCLSAFGHLLRWSIRQSLMAHWEVDASAHAFETCANLEACQRQKRELEFAFGTAWVFDCPICDDGVDTFVCELDEARLGEGAITLKRAACANCGLEVRQNSPFLADALCRDQVAAKRDAILRDFGITEA